VLLCFINSYLVTTQPAKVWDYLTGRCLLRLGGHQHTILSIHAIPPILFTGCGDGFIRSWDLKTGVLVNMVNAHIPHGVLSIDLDESRLVTGSTDSSIKVWELGSYRELMSYNGDSQAIWCVRFVGDLVVAGCQDHSLLFIDIQGGRLLQKLDIHSRPVRSISQKNGIIYTGGDDGVIYELQKQNTTEYECTQLFGGHKEGIRSVVCFEDRLLSASSDGIICVWDVTNGMNVCF
jgi:WD40 repeat protein